MSTNARWSPKLFAMLLERAKGVRSWRQFAAECGISYVQMHKLAGCAQENPPRPKLIRKIASNAFGDVDLEDLLFAAGMNRLTGPLPEKNAPADADAEKLRALRPRDSETVRALIDILYAKSGAGKRP